MKVKGPLLSLKASGTIADVLTFSNRTSGQQCRFQNKQKDKTTPDRTVQRDKYRDCVNYYKDLSDESKRLAQIDAVNKNYSGFNYYMKLCLIGDTSFGDFSIHGNRIYGVYEYGKNI